jgi:hypothetical protein
MKHIHISSYLVKRAGILKQLRRHLVPTESDRVSDALMSNQSTYAGNLGRLSSMATHAGTGDNAGSIKVHPQKADTFGVRGQQESAGLGGTGYKHTNEFGYWPSLHPTVTGLPALSPTLMKPNTTPLKLP